MMKKLLCAFLMVFAVVGMASAAPSTVNVGDFTMYKSDATHTLTYTVVQTNAATAKNCTLYDNIDGSWGRDTAVAVDMTILNSSANSIVIDPSWPSTGTTHLWNLACKTNASTTIKDAANSTITFYVYQAQYSTADLNSEVVDVFGTGVKSGLGFVDLLVLLAIVGVIVGILAGVVFKGGRILGMG